MTGVKQIGVNKTSLLPNLTSEEPGCFDPIQHDKTRNFKISPNSVIIFSYGLPIMAEFAPTLYGETPSKNTAPYNCTSPLRPTASTCHLPLIRLPPPPSTCRHIENQSPFPKATTNPFRRRNSLNPPLHAPRHRNPPPHHTLFPPYSA